LFYCYSNAVKAINSESVREELEVLHYTGYDNDRGGIVSIVRSLGEEGLFRSILGVSKGFKGSRDPALPVLEFDPIEGEQLNFRAIWRARRVAVQVSAWLKGNPLRVYHGHSRAGLAVGLWLNQFGERRIVVSVHNYGKQRWFYRLSASSLGERLYWLSPQMRLYYRCGGSGWDHCVPGCIGKTQEVDGPNPNHVQGSLRLGGIGAIAYWKRWDLVLDAISRLPATFRDRVSFAHIGSADGSAESIKCLERLRAKTVYLNLESQVEWGGQKPSSRELLSRIDCLVIASENEPFSIAMLEALGRGIPVLAADSGGAKDVVIPSVNGWLFQSGDSADLSRSLSELCEGDSLRRTRIRSEDLQAFRASAVAAKWSSIYASLIKSK
jgi:glycosyltransferase involved in cell wall biosynthesis